MISQTSRYALRAALLIANKSDEGPTKVRVIAEELGVPQNYLSKILHRLVGAGILRSTRGPSGGFQLAKEPAQVSLASLVSELEAGEGQGGRRCLLGYPVCSDKEPCAAHGRWCKIADMVEVFFEDTTLEDLRNRSRSLPQ